MGWKSGSFSVVGNSWFFPKKLNIWASAISAVNALTSLPLQSRRNCLSLSCARETHNNQIILSQVLVLSLEDCFQACVSWQQTLLKWISSLDTSQAQRGGSWESDVQTFAGSRLCRYVAGLEKLRNQDMRFLNCLFSLIKMYIGRDKLQ